MALNCCLWGWWWRMRAKKAITQKGEAGRKSTNPGQPEFGQPAKPQCLNFYFYNAWLVFIYIFLRQTFCIWENLTLRRYFYSCKFCAEMTKMARKWKSEGFVSSLQRKLFGKEFLSCSRKFPIFLSPSILKCSFFFSLIFGEITFVECSPQSIFSFLIRKTWKP